LDMYTNAARTSSIQHIVLMKPTVTVARGTPRSPEKEVLGGAGWGSYAAASAIAPPPRLTRSSRAPAEIYRHTPPGLGPCLQGRLSDKSPTVRTRAASSIGVVLLLRVGRTCVGGRLPLFNQAAWPGHRFSKPGRLTFNQAAWPGHFSKPFCFFNFHGKLLLHSPDLQLMPFLSPYSNHGGN
jgi:hypothetical protein